MKAATARSYKIRWNNGRVEDNVMISDGAQYTWEDVAEVLSEYRKPQEEKS